MNSLMQMCVVLSVIFSLSTGDDWRSYNKVPTNPYNCFLEGEQVSIRTFRKYSTSYIDDNLGFGINFVRCSLVSIRVLLKRQASTVKWVGFCSVKLQLQSCTTSTVLQRRKGFCTSWTLIIYTSNLSSKYCQKLIFNFLKFIKLEFLSGII